MMLMARDVEQALRQMMAAVSGDHPVYRMIEYHLGWRDERLEPIVGQTGKRTRGTMTLLCALAAGGTVEGAASRAAAVELVHNLSLIYDDIQDESAYRRGRPTIWALWGKAQAINAGACMHAMVARALNTPAGLEAHLALQETVQTLAEGQHEDLALEEGSLAPTEAAYLSMIAKKTGSLFGTAAYLGARSAGASMAVASAYREFGTRVGVAYQLVDDVWGIWGAPNGEKPADDLVRRKKTLPVLIALQSLDESVHRAYWHGEWSAGCPDAQALDARLSECNARGQTLQRASAEAARAAEVLTQVGPDPIAGAQLWRLLDLLLQPAVS